MGMKLGLHHFLVKPFQSLPAEYSAVQAPEPQHWEFVNKMVLACIIQTAVSWVRFVSAKPGVINEEAKAVTNFMLVMFGCRQEMHVRAPGITA